MKVRNYEKYLTINFLLIILFLLEILLLIYLYNKKIYTYESLNSVVVKDNLVLLIISDKQYKTLNKNSFLYLDGKKIKYKVFEDRGYVIENKKEKYKDVVLEFKFNKEYKVNDSLRLVLKDKKIRLIEIFKIIWEGD